MKNHFDAISRRRFLQLGGATSVAMGMGIFPASASIVTDQKSIYKVFYDSELPVTASFADQARRQGYVAESVSADITKLWFDDLRPFWQKGGGVIAGLTNSSAAYCLEVLAGDEGMRTYFRAIHQPQYNQKYNHTIEDSMYAPQVVATLNRSGDWPSSVFSMLSNVDVHASTVKSLNYAPMVHSEPHGPRLVSWVIAPARRA